jgi:hypothetical protein
VVINQAKKIGNPEKKCNKTVQEPKKTDIVP